MCGPLARTELDADHAAKARHLPAGELVLRMRRQADVIHILVPHLLDQPLGDFPPVRVVLSHAEVKRLRAAQCESGIERPRHGARGGGKRLRYPRRRSERVRRHVTAADLCAVARPVLRPRTRARLGRLTLAHGVGARAPYLDSDLLSRVPVLSQKYKLRKNMGKFILRELVEERFPGNLGRSLAWRKKHGFEVPVDAWLRKNLRECVEDRLSPVKLARSGLLDVTIARRIMENFYSSSRDTPLRRKLWLLLCFQTWYELHEKGFGFR